MATFKTTTRTAQEERTTKRNASPSFRDLQQPVCVAVFDYTLAGTETDADVIELGSLEREGAVIIPELSRVIDTGGAADDVTASFTLQKVNAAGTATALTGAAAVDDNSAAFTRMNAAAVEVGHDDILRLLISSTTDLDADATISVEIAYRVPNHV